MNNMLSLVADAQPSRSSQVYPRLVGPHKDTKYTNELPSIILYTQQIKTICICFINVESLPF